jgi:hypothetical protein
MKTLADGTIALSEEVTAVEHDNPRARSTAINFRRRLLARAIVDLHGPAGPDGAPCWLWSGTINPNGYGSITRGKWRGSSHRAMWQLLIGPIPADLQLDHLCHGPKVCKATGRECLHRRCCNPAHLEPTTNRTNALRGASFAASNVLKTHCGTCNTPFDEANTYWYGSSRYCRACHRDSARRARKERVA